MNKIKLKLPLIMRVKLKGKNKGREKKNSLIDQLIEEKAIQAISFTKLFLLYNKYTK
jgi:hypothetical protein